MSMEIHIIRYDDTLSTNQIALELGGKGALHGTVVTARQQSGGKGRMGRSFYSPPGGLYFSLILRPSIEFGRLALITIAVGVICSELIEKVSGQNIMLKWPNDLYLQGKKLGGILCESAPCVNGKVPFLVIGIGINVNTRQNDFSDELRGKMTSLRAITKRSFDLEDLMQKIVTEINLYTTNPESKSDEFLTAWRQRDFLYGRPISWKAAGTKKNDGIGAGLLDDGRYRLKNDDGTIVPIVGGELGFSLNEI